MGDGIVSEQDKKSGFEVGEIREIVHDKRVTRRDILKGAAAVGRSRGLRIRGCRLWKQQ